MWKKFKEKYHHYILPLVCITFYVVISMLAHEIKWIGSTLKMFLKLISPFIWGFGLAFILSRPMYFFEKNLEKMIHSKKIVRVIASVLTIFLMLGIIVGVFVLIVPQIIQSLDRLAPILQQVERQLKNFNEFLKTNFEIDLNAFTYIFNYKHLFSKFFSNGDVITVGVNLSTSTLKNLLNMLISMICAVYLLIDKEKFKRYMKKVNYALFNRKTADAITEITLLAKDIFNNFIIGKLIDSLIVGILCYIGMIIFKFDYAVLISLLVGLTNVIPVFGPFIGGIPGVIILTLVNPTMGLWFALFIFALQQFDGNILGPYILGDKLGLPSLGILIAVVIGGGLFGFIGMLLGVPIFALFYELSKRKINQKLKEKEIVIDN